MNYEDLSFEVTNEEGITLECDVLSVVPNKQNEKEPFIVFTDYTLDEQDDFVLQFGKVKEEKGEYKLEKIEDKELISEIREQLTDEIVSYVNQAVQDNLNE